MENYKNIADVYGVEENAITVIDSFDSNRLQKEYQKLSAIFDTVLKQSIENYLGRTIDLNKDSDRFNCVNHPDTNVTYFYVDGNLIGRMSVNIGFNYLDFENNKASCEIKFTPLSNQKSRPY